MTASLRIRAAFLSVFTLACVFAACRSDAPIQVTAPWKGSAGVCAPPASRCGGACVETLVDPWHCGGCDQACDPGQVCDGAGQCAASCQGGFVYCDARCIDPLSDNTFCGASDPCVGGNQGVDCPGGRICNGAGKCELSCQAGLLDCGGTCIDPRTDNAYCGAKGDCDGNSAGIPCGPGFLCNGAGTCMLSCQPGLIQCGGKCIDPNTDNAFCGAAADCKGPYQGEDCAAGFVCNGAGTCALSCQQGLVACAGKCIDPDTNNAFCGATGNCYEGNSGTLCEPGSICSAGECRLSCQPGLVACGGKCTDPNTDNAHCGAGDDCAENPGAVCDPGFLCNGHGSCDLSCQQGLVACAGKCIDPATDDAHCGAGDDCSQNPGSACGPGFVCDGAGNCQLSCQPELIACNGKCVDPRSDNAYCGASGDCLGDPGEPCAAGSICSDSSCQFVCQAGQVECAGKCIDPMTDEKYCGASDNCLVDAGEVCSGGHVCAEGACSATCLPGQIICDGICIDPQTNNPHCGASGDCLGPNAGSSCNGMDSVCINGACYINCPVGQVFCNGICAHPEYDPKYCGAGADCENDPGVQCNALEACVLGKCQPVITSSCALILALDPTATDGAYKVQSANKQLVDVYCDMTHGGVTYEELAMGKHDKSYPGYTLVSLADLTDTVISQAFVHLFNLTNSLKHIDTGWTSGACCIKLAEHVGAVGVLKLGTSLVYPATTANAQACSPPGGYTQTAYRFYLQAAAQYAPKPLPSNYFVTKAPGTLTTCATNNNPGWFWKKY